MEIKNTKIPWRYILKLFLGLRIITLIAAYAGQRLMPFKPSFPYWDTILEPFGQPLFWSWANFDGVHYIMLAEKGYAFGLTQAFFPGYFLLIKLINVLLHNYLLSGLLISHVCFVLMLAMLYKLVRLDYSEKIARRVLLLISFFPTSFYFLSLYTESLFLLCLISVFYWYRMNKIKKAGIIGIALTLTRVVGVFVIPSLLLELKGKDGKIKIKDLFWSLIPAIGLIAYMFYLWIKFKDPFLFVHVQSDFGAGRETGRFVMLYQVVWRYIKMIVTVDRHNPIYFSLWLEFVSSLSAVGLLIWGYIKKIRPSYLLFSFLAFILPTLTGTFSSMPRYVLVLFPIFIVLALIKNKWIRYTIILVNITLLFICTMWFTRGYWIA